MRKNVMLIDFMNRPIKNGCGYVNEYKIVK